MADPAGERRFQDNSAAIGAQIRKMREARGLSAAELARQSGISKATLSTLESGAGNPRFDTLSAIAVALRLPLGDLIVPVGPAHTVLQRGTPPPEHSKQELLQRIRAGVLTEVWRLRIRNAGHLIESPAHTDGTMEHIQVAAGALRLGSVENPCEAEAGDFVVFPADVPHFYEAKTNDVEAIIIMTYPTSGW